MERTKAKYLFRFTKKMDPQQYNNQPQMILPGQDQFGQQISGQPMSGQAMQGQSIPEQMMQGQPMPGQMTPGQGLMQEPAQILMPQGQPMSGQMAQTQMYAQGQMPQNQNAAALGSAAMAANQTPPSSHESPTSTQATLMISELRDNVVIMKDGSFRAVVACKSINFDLMSDMEREGVEYSYQNFLNSLKFTVQILIRSQRVDIGPYLERLNEIRRNNDNMLLGVLMDDYINFIDVLSQEANIMDTLHWNSFSPSPAHSAHPSQLK